MGLDFVVLMREGDDSPGNWPGYEIDARRADDPDPVVQERVRELYEDQYSPEALAQSASFQGWPRMIRPTDMAGWIFTTIGFVVLSPLAFGGTLLLKLKDRMRYVPAFEEWIVGLKAQEPPPIAMTFGPNCPVEAKPVLPAMAQSYGFRGRAVQPEINILAGWWASRNAFDLNLLYYGEAQFEDRPTEPGALPEDDGEPTIGEAANLFDAMDRDCTAAFPEVAAAADAVIAQEAVQPDGGIDYSVFLDAITDIQLSESAKENVEKFGPYPDRDFDGVTDVYNLIIIRSAAQFFRFWEGRGYPIASDY